VTPNRGIGPPWGAFCQITLTSCYYYYYYYLRQRSSDSSVNKTILKPLLALATRHTWDFSNVKFRVAAQLAGSLGKAAKFRSHTISEKVIGFRRPDYDPDRAQKLISSSMCRHLSTRNISSKSMHAFWVTLLTDRQTDRKQTRTKTCTPSFVGGNKHLTANSLQHSTDYSKIIFKIGQYLPKLYRRLESHVFLPHSVP